MQKYVVMAASVVASACGGGAGSMEVFKSLGSSQCTGGGTTVAALRSELAGAGVDVLASTCGFDGRVYPAVCGAPDGRIAIFEVPASQLPVAVSLNYRPFSDAPEAMKVACG